VNALLSSRRTLFASCAAATALLLTCGVPRAAARPDDPGAFGRSHRPVCGAVPARFARCHSEVVTDAQGEPLATPAPDGYGPADLQSAYNISDQASSAGGTQTIAIVDAYDDPNAESDLGVYRAQFGLPACTTANGCFRKVNQNGGTSYPSANASWAQEISLDLDMASAICPRCKILLVEASSNSFANLAAAVDRAAALGATQISNSYGGNEYSAETSDESHYNHAGVAVTVSSGDSGYGTEFPAASRYVTAVGGTSLSRDASTSRGWSETAWSGAGSGCSAYVSKPAWQTDSGCARRTVADVAAVADPNTGVAVYDSFPYNGQSGWLVFGGTSVAAPIVAGFDALIGSSAGTPSYAYNHLSSYYDVISGNNGSCKGSYLCTAGAGYDGPTGLGTPKGTPVAAPPPPPAAAPSGGGAGAPAPGGTTSVAGPVNGAVTIDRVKPNVSSLLLSSNVFRAARSGPTALAAISVGTRVTFVLSERATATFRVERVSSGRVVGRRCVTATRSNRGARRCTLYRLLSGRFSRAGSPGLNAVRYAGRLAGHALSRGRYRLDLMATDAAGNRSRVLRAAFRIV
jgi:hypothetical protein